jgi:hypothetical protein
MLWHLDAASMPIAVNFQTSPYPALFLFAVISVLLWFAVGRARRRDERRARVRDLVQWRSRPPRY